MQDPDQTPSGDAPRTDPTSTRERDTSAELGAGPDASASSAGCPGAAARRPLR